MEGKSEDSVNKIQKSLETLLNTKTSIKPKRSTKVDKNKEIFEKIIMTLEELDVRSYILENDLDLVVSKYESKFYAVIDSLIEISFGPKITELIMFYLYERKNDNGTLSSLTDDTGRIIPLENPTDLWNLIQAIKQNK